MSIRIVTAVAVLISAGIHLEQWFLVFQDTAVIGPAMLVNFVGGLAIAILLLVWRHHWLPWILAIVFGAATLAAFLTSVTVGLFGVHEQWTIWEVFVAAVVEAVAIVGGFIGLWQARRLPVPA